MSELPKGWVETTLRQVAEKITDGSHNPPREQPAGLPMLSARNIRDGMIWFDEYRHISLEDFELEHRRTRISKGDVLLTIVGAIGRSAVVETDEPFTLQRSVAVLGEFAGLSPDYLQKYTSGPEYQDWLLGNAKGTAQKGVYLKKLADSVIKVAPFAEQKRIVAKLDTLNAKSARARTELARIETLVFRYKQAVLSKAFSGELTRGWRIQMKVKEPSIGKLEELLSIPVRNGLSVKGSDTPPGFPALKLSALRSRDVNLDDVRYIPVDDLKAARFLLEAGDILVSRGNGTRSLVGIASFVPTLARPTVFPDTAFRIRVDIAKALPLWLTSMWNAPQVRSQIELVAKTTAGIWKISQKDLATIRLSFPSTLEEQHEIVRRIESAFAKIDRLAKGAKRALELVGRLDEAILAKAFRGELVPQDENDEPAEHLLARIRAERAGAPKEKTRTIKRKTTMLTARDFLKTKLENWPADGVSFQDLRREFGGSYDDLKEAVFASVSDEKSTLQQIFDEKTSMMTIRKRGR